MNKRELEVVIAPVSDSIELQAAGYLCINVVGIFKGLDKVEHSFLKRVPNVNAWNYRHDYEGSDFSSASNGYMHLLELKKEKIFNHLRNMLDDRPAGKVAFIGMDNPLEGYCFRYLFYNFFVRQMYFYLPEYRLGSFNNVNGISMGHFLSIAYTDIYWKHRKVDITIEEAEQLLEANEFIFAKTMPDNPHYYTLKKRWKQPDKFADIVNLIRVHGTPTIVMNTMWRSLQIGGYLYWNLSCYDKAEDTDLLNRKPIELA